MLHGDVFDFLAEDLQDHRPELDPALDASAGEPLWVPFIRSESVAAAVAERFTARDDDSRQGDRDVLDAIAACLAAAIRVDVMIGNHDLELVYPAVREVLTRRLAPRPETLRWHLEGATLCPDRRRKVRILHGNATDPFNHVDYGSLRDPRAASIFVEPPGSRLVASVMNPIKQVWPFVDILKPEVEAAIPLLLWLDPNQRTRLRHVARLFLESQGLYVGDVDVAGADAPGQDPLEALLAQSLGPSGAPEGDRDVSWTSARGWIELLTQDATIPAEERPLAPLRRALTALATRFSRGASPVASTLAVERDAGLREAVEQEWSDGAQAVIAGHTHIAHDVTQSGHRYLNTGTWADVAVVGTELTTMSDEALRGWLTRLALPGPHWTAMVDDRRWYAEIQLDDADDLVDVQLRKTA